MTLPRVFFLFITLVVTAVLGATIPTAVDESTCRDLCSSCDGEAKFEEGRCECSIDANNGTECLGRMKRHANEHGLDVVSCDLEGEEARSTRCTLAHKNLYRKTDMDRVAKYFMDDGPITGSIFIAPPLTHKAKHHPDTVVGNANCGCPTHQAIITQDVPSHFVASPLTHYTANQVPDAIVGNPNCVGTSQGIITQPAETMVSSPLIVQPKEFMPVEHKVAEPTKIKTSAPKVNSFGLHEIAPQFLSMLGEVLTKPILGLPQAIQTVSEVPGVSDLVEAPAHLLNSLADQMAGRSKVAKQNLDNYREVVGKSRDEVMLGLSNYKENHKPVVSAEPPMVAAPAPKPSSSPTKYSVVNPHPMISWLNPTVGAPAPTQYVQTQLVGAPAPTQYVQTQLVGAPAPTQYVSSPMPTQYYSAPIQSQIVGAPAPSSSGQMVGSPLSQLFGNPTLSHLIGALQPTTQLLSTAAQLINAIPTQFVGSPSHSSPDCGGSQMVGSPQMVNGMPVIQNLGTIPLNSYVGQVSPTYLVSSPMSYYSPAVQPPNTIEDHHVGEAPSLEEIPFSSVPQKKICKKSTRSMKYTRDVKSVEGKEEEDVMTTTTTTTTEVPMIERTTTQKPKASVIGKIKPKKVKVEKKLLLKQ